MERIEKIALGSKMLEGIGEDERVILDSFKRGKDYYRIDTQEQFDEMLECEVWYGKKHIDIHCWLEYHKNTPIVIPATGQVTMDFNGHGLQITSTELLRLFSTNYSGHRIRNLSLQHSQANNSFSVIDFDQTYGGGWGSQSINFAFRNVSVNYQNWGNAQESLFNGINQLTIQQMFAHTSGHDPMPLIRNCNQVTLGSETDGGFMQIMGRTLMQGGYLTSYANMHLSGNGIFFDNLWGLTFRSINFNQNQSSNAIIFNKCRNIRSISTSESSIGTMQFSGLLFNECDGIDIPQGVSFGSGRGIRNCRNIHAFNCTQASNNKYQGINLMINTDKCPPNPNSTYGDAGSDMPAIIRVTQAEFDNLNALGHITAATMAIIVPEITIPITLTGSFPSGFGQLYCYVNGAQVHFQSNFQTNMGTLKTKPGDLVKITFYIWSSGSGATHSGVVRFSNRPDREIPQPSSNVREIEFRITGTETSVALAIHV